MIFTKCCYCNNKIVFTGEQEKGKRGFYKIECESCHKDNFIEIYNSGEWMILTKQELFEKHPETKEWYQK